MGSDDGEDRHGTGSGGRSYLWSLTDKGAKKKLNVSGKCRLRLGVDIKRYEWFKPGDLVCPANDASSAGTSEIKKELERQQNGVAAQIAPVGLHLADMKPL